MTEESIISANTTPYRRHIIEAGNLKQPAKLIPAETALVEKVPLNNDPGPYLIGIGDIIAYEEPMITPSGGTLMIRELIVNEDGLINFFSG